MKTKLISLAICLMLVSPAEAMTYKKFRKFVYWPGMVVLYIVGGPAIIASAYLQHKDKEIKTRELVQKPE